MPRRESDCARQAAEPDSRGGTHWRARGVLSRPTSAIRRKRSGELTEGGRGADSVIEAVGTAQTWEWALQMVRRGGTVNLFGGCPRGTQVAVDPNALHYSEITIKSTFHHTPRFIREALESRVARRNSLERFRERGNSAHAIFRKCSST